MHALRMMILSIHLVSRVCTRASNTEKPIIISYKFDLLTFWIENSNIMVNIYLLKDKSDLHYGPKYGIRFANHIFTAANESFTHINMKKLLSDLRKGLKAVYYVF